MICLHTCVFLCIYIPLSQRYLPTRYKHHVRNQPLRRGHSHIHQGPQDLGSHPTKAEQYAKEKGLDADAVFPEARLIDDQNPLTFQVQTSTRTVKTTLGRLTGVETEPFKDSEKTLADLHARVQAALELLETADAAVVNARAEERVGVLVHNNCNFDEYVRLTY